MKTKMQVYGRFGEPVWRPDDGGPIVDHRLTDSEWEFAWGVGPDGRRTNIVLDFEKVKDMYETMLARRGGRKTPVEQTVVIKVRVEVEK